MNVLAEEQKKMLDKKLSLEEYEKRKKDFFDLYYKLRSIDENKWWNKLTLQQRKSIHWLILEVYKLKNRLGGFSYDVIGNRRTPTNKPVIFVITHVGKFDIEVVSEAIKDHYYLLSGDFEHIQGIVDAPFLGLNGVFYFNEKDKEDRKEVSEKMINHLTDGGNLMYFIEGTWNLTPNLPMLPCYWGIVDIAKKGNAIIVPIAAEQYGKHFKVNIGENFDMCNFLEGNEEKSRAITTLRDILATLKWEIWESEPKLNRCDLCGTEWEQYISNRFEEWPYFNEEYIDSLIYKPKDVITYDEAFEHIKRLIPKSDNTFLFNKRIKG